MGRKTIGRCAPGAFWLFLFMATRIRVKLNGSDAGKMLMANARRHRPPPT